jgi:AGCS family alanine or glycine:cation symporter
MDVVEKVVNFLNQLVWSTPDIMPAMVILLLGTGVFMTLRLKFIQIRQFGHAFNVIRGVYDDPKDAGDINHFQALTSALSATVGIGNIAGVAIAIHYGGPGSLFWMWLTAALGMALKYSECTLAMRYRDVHEDGSVSGGPMYYIEKGLGSRWKWLAVLVALMTFICSFGTGNANQSWTVADMVRSSFPVPTWLTGIVAGLFVALVILGGIKRIGAVTSRLVPIMCVLYVAGAFTVIVMNASEIPHALSLIVGGAFTPAGAVGGFAGSTFMYTLLWGIKRGLFSNEAGQGSAPIAHAAAKTTEPAREGVVALIEPFIDTLLICTMTGLVIVVTGTWSAKLRETVPFDTQQDISIVVEGAAVQKEGVILDEDQFQGTFRIESGRPVGASFFKNDSLIDDAFLTWRLRTEDGSETPEDAAVVALPFDGSFTVSEDGSYNAISADGRQISFSKLGPDLQLEGDILQNAAPLTAWAFEKGLSPLFSGGRYIVTIAVILFGVSTAISWSYYGDRAVRYLFGPRMVMPYKILYCGAFMFAATVPLEAVWTFGDTALGLMAIPNLIAILFLSGITKRLTDEYTSKEHVRFK